MNVQLLEACLLLILTLNFLRTNFLTNQLALVVLALFYIAFLVLSSFGSKKGIFTQARFLLFFSIILILYSLLIVQRANTSEVHDGAILTKAATSALLSGKNPYEISYQSAFESVENKPLDVVYNSYMYSPMMFIINVPANFLADQWKGNEFIVTITLFFILSSIVASLLVREKLLFLILFSLNPVFVPLAFYGANEAIILFFLTFTILMIFRNKWTLATVSLALATGTKLLVLPFVPLYFLYLYLEGVKSFKGIKGQLFKLTMRQLAIFLLVNLIIYLPFAIWNLRDLIEDVVFYHLRGGVESHVIAGFLGIPSILSSLHLINADSRFPFYIFQILAGVVSLPFIYRFLRRSFSLSTLCIAFVIYFSMIFAFSRIMQSSYIAFLSQLLIFAAFVDAKKTS